MTKQSLYRLGAVPAGLGAVGFLWTGIEPQFVALLFASAPDVVPPPAAADFGPGWQPGLTSSAATYGMQMRQGTMIL